MKSTNFGNLTPDMVRRYREKKKKAEEFWEKLENQYRAREVAW